MKKLIINADDLGYSSGINRGIIKGFKDGIVTSTSLMVDEKATEEGVKLANENPDLGLGLHFQINKNDAGELLNNPAPKAELIEKAKSEFIRQLQVFEKLTEKKPDHIDGHWHVHRSPSIILFIKNWCQQNKIPFRDQINFIDSFYGKPDIQNLLKILENLPEGDSELMCHPGFNTPDLKSAYCEQREIELKTLMSNEIKNKIKELNIELINWKQVN